MLEVTSSAIRVRDVEKRQDGSRKPSFVPLRSHFAPSLLLPGQVQNFRTGATNGWTRLQVPACPRAHTAISSNNDFAVLMY